MGSVRRVAVLAGCVLATAVAALPAAADPRDDARAAATSFLDALAREDAAAACGLFSPAALERLGGRARCEGTFSDDEESADAAARSNLILAFLAAKRSASKRRGQYVRKGFAVKALAGDIERLAPNLEVKLGRGPKSAAGQLVTTVVLDTRTTARRLVLYCESDDGSIWRLSASAHGDPDMKEVAQGVPEAPKPNPPPAEPAFSFTIGAAVVDEAGKAYVTATLSYVEEGQKETATVVLVLVPSAGGYLVDDLLVSVLSGVGQGG